MLALYAKCFETSLLEYYYYMQNIPENPASCAMTATYNGCIIVTLYSSSRSDKT